jgi:hypothetical protein
MGRKTKDRPKVHITQPIQLLSAGKVVAVVPNGTPFAEPIGLLIVYWATFENTTDDLLEAVLRVNNSSELGWRNRNFSKRAELLKQEWLVFSKGQTDLITELTDILSLAHQGKNVRDMIAHKRITSGYSNRGMFIKFKNELQVHAYTKAYYPDDLSAVANTIQTATVKLFNLKDGDPDSPVSSQSRSLLQRLRPDTANHPPPTQQAR